MIFCGIPLASRPISQRIGGFASFLAQRDWNVRLTAVDVRFKGTPFVIHDSHSDMDVEVIGKTHYGLDGNGRQVPLPHIEYLRECRAISARIAEMASQASADHILLSTTMPATLVAAVKLRRKHPSVWMDLDDWTSGQFVAGGGSRVMGLGYGVLERVLPHLAHHLTVCSRLLQHLYPRATFVPNFIREEDIFEHASMPTASDPIRVAFAGTLTGYYGHAELLNTIVSRRDEFSNVGLSILGEGPAIDTCRAIVERGGIGEIVDFSGHLSRRDMMDRLARSDIGVLPLSNRRHDRARFPLKMLDYLASGCAVAASNTGMARDVLTHERTGLLSQPGSMDRLVDDVLRLAKSPDLRSRLATGGRALVRQYDADTICEQWMHAISTGSRRERSPSRS